MTPTHFRKCLDALHWSQREFAAIINRNDRQVRRWAAGQAEIPPEVAAWLERWAGRMHSDPPPSRLTPAE
ncbi:nuclease [Niveispirillum sp. SYP-B3756]|nr:nuclease [Niveispirillum sp. SYP-B3756]